jgi:hypothetical protein
VLLVGLLWVVGVGVSLVLAREHLVAAESALHDGRAALMDAELGTATEGFARAQSRANDGLRQLRAPHVRLAAAIPLVGDSLRGVDAIALSVSDVGGAAHDLVAAVAAMPDGIDALRPEDGALPVEAIHQLAPLVAEVATALGLAVERVEQLPTDYVVEPVARERERFLELAVPASEGATIAAALAAHLPAFLGEEGPRRYVYAAANPAEPRGTGGYLGAYTVLDIEGGAFEIGTFTPAYDLPTLPARDLRPPNTSFARRYDPFGGGGFWQNINMTPDFPTAAAAITQLWEEVHGERVDGVISVDPFALQALLEVAGPIEVEGRSVDADTVVPYVTNEAYEELGHGSERQEIIGEVAAAALEAYLHAPDVDALTEAMEPLREVAAGGHLLLYSTDPEIQRAFRLAGIDGGFPEPSGDVFGVAVNDGSATKIDFYAQRSIDYEARLLRHGRVSSRLGVTIDNGAPTEGRSRHIIGPNVAGLNPGEMRLLASVFCGPTCQVKERPGDGEDPPRFSREQGFVFLDSWVRIPGGERTTLNYAWVTSDGWEAEEDVITYRLQYDDQVTVQPTRVSIRVHVPEGFEPIGLPEGARVQDEVIVWERGGERGDVELVVRLRPIE